MNIETIKAEIFKLINVDPQHSINMLIEFKEEFIKSNSKQDIALYYYFFGHASQILGNFTNSLNSLKRALQIYEELEDKFSIQKVHLALGTVNRALGEFNDAIENYSNAINGPDESVVSATHNNIAVIYFSLGETDAALLYYEKALKSFIKEEKYGYAASVMLNIGKLYILKSRIDEGIEISKKAYEISNKISMPSISASALLNIAKAKIEVNEYKDALIYLYEAEVIANQHNLDNIKPSIILSIAESNNIIGNKSVAIEYYSIALENHSAENPRQEIEISLQLAKFYNENEDFERGFKIMQRIVFLKDLLYESEKNQELNKLISKFEVEERRLTNAKLEQEQDLNRKLRVKTAEIEEKNRLLDDYNQELLQFSYAISHDFREPVRLLINFSQILAKSLNGRLNTYEEEIFGFIVSNSQRIDRLINDLYKYASLNKEILPHSRVDVSKLISDVVQLMTLSIKEANASVAVDSFPIIYSYEGYIFQLFQNLFSNSLKYRKEDEDLLITIRNLSENNLLKIHFIDNGIGIPLEDQRKVFKLFKRSHVAKNFEGTGLGLALCQKICTRLGGKINVESDGKSGTLFSIEIPMLAEE